jgi:hypothetical protein
MLFIFRYINKYYIPYYGLPTLEEIIENKKLGLNKESL